ncbi:MAG: hypothetical protein U5N85_03840 [Arcicella sp.]|nr:hypothetical protein [Arcicella sp.]
MNNFFNYQRFALLLKRQWVENQKLFLMATLVMLGIGILFYAPNLDWPGGYLFNIDSRTGIFFVGLFITGSLFTNYIFKDLSDKNSSTSYLLVPASHFEKVSSGIFYAIIVFPVVYSIVFYALDSAFVSIGNSILESNVSKGLMKIEKLNLNKSLFGNLRDIDFSRAKLILPIWLVIQAFMILGSISFMRWSFIKTCFTGFAVLLILGLTIGSMDKLFLEDLRNQAGGNQGFQVKPTSDMFSNYLQYIVKYALAPLFSVIAYFKLKEKQI